MTVRDAILKVGLDPQAVLPVRDSAASSHVRSGAASSHVRSVLINEATILRQGDVIRLVAVISGG
jgi:sulfur carrier protein ThiS